MMKKRRRQQIVFSIIVVLVIAIVVVINVSGEKSNAELRAQILSGDYDLTDQDSDTVKYEDYKKEIADSGENVTSDTEPIVIAGKDYEECTWGEAEELDAEGIITEASGSIRYSFDVAEAGLYTVEVGYYPIADSTSAITRSIYINGILPFEEAEDLVFERMWQDESKDYLMVSDSNQATPDQIQSPEWTSKFLEDSGKTTTGSLDFYFESGSNTISFVSVGGRMGISYIKLNSSASLLSYEEYLSTYEQQGVSVTNSSELEDGAIKVQAEDAKTKSTSVLIPENDRTSPLSEPYDASNIVLNTIGGSEWSTAGQSISWEVTVPQSGLYKIATRYLQAENRDFYSCREIKINGEIPFEEASLLKYYYSNDFQVEYFGDDAGDFYFYLEEGTNMITLTVTMGDLSYAYEQATLSVSNLNVLYRSLTAVMGTDPDVYRDYDIVSNVPDMVTILQTEYYRLTTVMESLGDSLGNNTKTNSLAKLLYQMEGLIQKPDTIKTELSYFSSNLTALGDWVIALGNQPLQMDYLLVAGEEYELPQAEGNFVQSLVHSAKSFIGSFTNDYKTAASSDNSDEEKTTVTVWIATSTRDQYDIAQKLFDQEFADRDINIELKMISADAVTPSTLTGNGPDVVLQVDYTTPNNFAFRDAAYDLTQFEDFESVASEFSTGAMEYFEYENGYYAIPDSMSYPVVYYRTDIFDQLGLEVPETWEDLNAVLPYLEAENMSAYFGTTNWKKLGGETTSSAAQVNLIFSSMLYQNGEELYSQDQSSTGLSTDTAMQVFKQWTEYYTKQGFSTTIDVVTRFRTGEVPLIIEDYTYVNNIKAAAPEIDGSWAIAPIPGTVLEDGSVNTTTTCTVSGAMIIKNSVEENENADAAWEALKWWVSEDTQYKYASQLEAQLGDAGAFPVANLNALETYSKENGTWDSIEKIIENMRGSAQRPGSYIVGRSVQNAWTSVVTDNLDPVDTLYSVIDDINTEMEVKRKEFGLDR